MRPWCFVTRVGYEPNSPSTIPIDKEKMCLCDDKYFKVVDIKTGKEKLYKRADSIARRFSIPKSHVFGLYIALRMPLRHDGESYRVEANKHPECQILRRKIIEHFGHRPSYLPPDRIQRYKDAVIRMEELG